MQTQKEYWDKKINEWSSASYSRGSKISTIEKIATFFRAVNRRKDAAIELIGPIAKNKTVLDLGCGMGEFTFDLVSYNPKKIIAVDISPSAIREIQKQIKKKKLNKKIEAGVSDIRTIDQLPACDIIVGLGFIDYFTKEELTHLFKMIEDTPYLFSYFEKKPSLFNLLHKIYITIQQCPGAYKYSRQEMNEIIPNTSKPIFIQKDGLQFITNMVFKTLDNQ